MMSHADSLQGTASARSSAHGLARGVLADLRKTPKQLSPTWFYDEYGSQLFDAICELPEYYVTRTELEIMHRHMADIAARLGPHVAVIEYGSGSSMKTRVLLDHLESPAVYMPVDISRMHLLDAAGALARDYPELRIKPVCADFMQPFSLGPLPASAARRVVYFPGSTIGNFETDAARRLLTSIRTLIGGNGCVLIGVDLKKDPSVLQRAYDDAAGVTAEFNLNALRHLNHKLGADFDLSSFEHRAVWSADHDRIEMYLVSLRDQVVHLGNEQIHFARGEQLCTEYSHKYTLESFARLASEAGLVVSHVWTDPQNLFSIQLLERRWLL